ncbi:nuclear transport factor 2 family protein [Streptomyces sp. NPDC002920]
MTDDNATVARTFLEAVFELDAEVAIAQLADDVTMDFMFAPEGFPRRSEGIEEAAKLLRSMVSGFWLDIRATRMDVRHEADPQRVAAEYASEGTLANGKPYVQKYASFFTVHNGKIVRFTEYADPFPILAGVQES